MDSFYVGPYKKYYNESFFTSYVFVSNRLYKIIEKKVSQGKWMQPYWPLDNVLFDSRPPVENYIGRAISSTGLMLFTKDFHR